MKQQHGLSTILLALETFNAKNMDSWSLVRWQGRHAPLYSLDWTGREAAVSNALRRDEAVLILSFVMIVDIIIIMKACNPLFAACCV